MPGTSTAMTALSMRIHEDLESITNMNKDAQALATINDNSPPPDS
jgi:hypothetical protein